MNQHLAQLSATSKVLFALSGGASMYFLDPETRKPRTSGDLDWTVSGRTRKDGLDVQKALLDAYGSQYIANDNKGELLVALSH